MKIAVVGSGMMGKAAAFNLVQYQDMQEIVLIDIDEKKLMETKKAIQSDKITIKVCDVSDKSKLLEIIKGCNSVLSAVTYKYNYHLAKISLEAKAHFCDLGGNNSIVEKELSLDQKAKEAGITIIPDCGLAPGLVSILAKHALLNFDELEEIKLMVGGLPQNPKPPLNYKIVFSPTGLINEYKEKAIVIKNGKIEEVNSLEDIEEVEFPQPFGKLEAFNTSGGTSTLPKTFLHKVKNLEYKTIRYKGHCKLIKAMMDIGLAEENPITIGSQEVIPRDFFEALLAKKCTDNDKDVILLKTIAKGMKKGKRTLLECNIIDYYDEKNDITAMMRMTAYPASIIALMMARGDIKEKGAIPQEVCIPPYQMIESLQNCGINIQIFEKEL